MQHFSVQVLGRSHCSFICAVYWNNVDAACCVLRTENIFVLTFDVRESEAERQSDRMEGGENERKL